jgi:hypothetical protein
VDPRSPEEIKADRAMLFSLIGKFISIVLSIIMTYYVMKVILAALVVALAFYLLCAFGLALFFL